VSSWSDPFRSFCWAKTAKYGAGILVGENAPVTKLRDGLAIVERKIIPQFTALCKDLVPRQNESALFAKLKFWLT
jgi:hypothetical protein